MLQSSHPCLCLQLLALCCQGAVALWPRQLIQAWQSGEDCHKPHAEVNRSRHVSTAACQGWTSLGLREGGGFGSSKVDVDAEIQQLCHIHHEASACRPPMTDPQLNVIICHNGCKPCTLFISQAKKALDGGIRAETALLAMSGLMLDNCHTCKHSLICRPPYPQWTDPDPAHHQLI